MSGILLTHFLLFPQTQSKASISRRGSCAISRSGNPATRDQSGAEEFNFTSHKSRVTTTGRPMIRKLRTQRDNQQWMLDLALNMRGRVQNFERDDLEVPAGKRARNYRMLPKVWREAAARHEALARRAQA